MIGWKLFQSGPEDIKQKHYREYKLLFIFKYKVSK